MVDETSSSMIFLIAMIMTGCLIVLSYFMFSESIEVVLTGFMDMAEENTENNTTEYVEEVELEEIYNIDKELSRNKKSLFTKVFGNTLISEMTHVPVMGRSEVNAIKEAYPEMRMSYSMENQATRDNDFDYFIETTEDELYYIDIELNYLDGDKVKRELVEEGTHLHNQYLHSQN